MKKHGSNIKNQKDIYWVEIGSLRKAACILSDFFQYNDADRPNTGVQIIDIFWRPNFCITLRPWQADAAVGSERRRNISRGYMGKQYIAGGFSIYYDRNINIII